MTGSTAEPLNAAIRAAAARLERAGLPGRDAAFDARLLARAVLDWDAATLLARAGEPAPAGFLPRYDELIARRERREPAAQVVGFREFWGRPFEVTRDVLVPRPETELIVEAALQFLQDGTRGTGARVVDVGTGSGCVAITMALEARLSVTATDISGAALKVAARNAARLHAAVALVRTNLLQGLCSGFDVITANLPYVRTGDRRALSPEVREYEPAEALFGGDDGLDLVRALLDCTPGYLAAGGRLFLEFGAGQDDRVAALVAERRTLTLHDVRADLRGIPRMAIVGLH
jgi:release factor glutamine methyltransferase